MLSFYDTAILECNDFNDTEYLMKEDPQRGTVNSLSGYPEMLQQLES